MHWFFGGGLSAHRFYLGFPASAIIQLMLTPISYVLLMNKSPAGLMVASALVAATRLSGLLPLAWSFLTRPAVFYPTPTRRTSFRHQPLTVPLFPEELQ
jgi:hypothetical protein